MVIPGLATECGKGISEVTYQMVEGLILALGVLQQ